MKKIYFFLAACLMAVSFTQSFRFFYNVFDASFVHISAFVALLVYFFIGLLKEEALLQVDRKNRFYFALLQIIFLIFLIAPVFFNEKCELINLFCCEPKNILRIVLEVLLIIFSEIVLVILLQEIGKKDDN